MNPCVLYFSRTGNTKRFAEVICELIKAPIFTLASTEPSIVTSHDLLILGTPVEGGRPAKETMAFVESLPKGDGKKAILFCTYRLFGNNRSLKILSKDLANKGYETILMVSKKMKPNQPADFSEALGEIKKVLEK